MTISEIKKKTDEVENAPDLTDKKNENQEESEKNEKSSSL